MMWKWGEYCLERPTTHDVVARALMVEELLDVPPRKLLVLERNL